MKSTTPKKRGCLYWIKLLTVGVIGAIVVLYVASYPLEISWITRSAYHSVCCPPPAEKGFNYEAVTLHSGDVTLPAWYIPSRNRAVVIFIHGEGGDRAELMGRAEMLIRHGYGALLYDRRGHGESTGGGKRAMGWFDVDDALAAVTWLQNREGIGPQRIGVLGWSVGGQIAIRAAVQSDKIRAVVADGPSLTNNRDVPHPTSVWDRWGFFENWIFFKGLELTIGTPAPPGIANTIGAIAPRPILLIACGADQDIETRIARHYYDHADEPKVLWEIPEAHHGGGPVARPEEYEERVVEFFDQAMLK